MQNGFSPEAGYGSDNDSQNSITRSGINTRNIIVTDEAGQIRLTGKTAEQSKAEIHTGTTTETAQRLSGSLSNVFDQEAVQNELDLQVHVTKEFGTVAPNLVATASEKLGNVSEYETVVLIKADAERAFAQTSDETERTKLVQIIQQADEYLATNKTAYETWKEGGIGRALLQSGVGGLMTGNANGALAGGTTSLAAPYLNAAEEKLGAAGGGILNAVSGAAIGYAVGGNVGSAAVGANVDWHNRQLHPDETNILNRLSQGQSSEAQYRLKAAACALTRCSEGVPTFDPAYQELRQLQQAGTQFNQEQRQLLAAGGFRYSNFDRLNDGRNRYDRPIHKITGAFNIGTGTSMAVGSARLAIGLCATSGGAACIAGGALGVLGVETGRNQIQQGGQQLFGTYRSDFGRRVLHSLGRPIEYEAPLVSDAKNLVMWGLESLLTRRLNGIPNTHQPPRTAHPAQSRPPEAASASVTPPSQFSPAANVPASQLHIRQQADNALIHFNDNTLGTGKSVGNLRDISGKSIDEIVANIPKTATVRRLRPSPHGSQMGLEYKWYDSSGVVNKLRIHDIDPSAPAGSNARQGWIARWQIRQQYYDPITGTLAHRKAHNSASPNYNPNSAKNTHIPILAPNNQQIQFIEWK